jgi:hypothetical protein
MNTGGHTALTFTSEAKEPYRMDRSVMEVGVISGYGCEAKKCCKHEIKINLSGMTGHPVAVPLVSVQSHVYRGYKPSDLSSDFLKNVSVFRIVFQNTTCTSSSSFTCRFSKKVFNILIM